MPAKIIVQGAAPELTDAVATLLEPYRFEVYRSDDLERTIRLARRHGPIDLVLCLDEGGRDLPSRLTAVSPDTRTLQLPVSSAVGAGLIATPGLVLDAAELMHVLERAVATRRRSPEISLDALKRALVETILAHGDLLARAGLTDAGDGRSVHDHAIGIAHELGLSPTHTDEIAFAALLQDIGLAALRIAAPQRSAGRVRQHPLQSVALIEKMQLPWSIGHIVEAHHERYDGLGYPHGLRGEEIPLGARILATVNAYFSMTRARPDRTALSERQALRHLKAEAGRQFDPEIVEVLLASLRDGLPETAPSHRIAVVTGDPSFGTVSRSKFEDLGHETELHRSAEDALVMLRERPPDAIVLDAGLTDASGFQLLHWLKQEEGLAGVPVLVVADQDDPSSPSFLAHDMGASDFLRKPVRPSRLVRRINALVRRRARLERATLSQIHDGEGLRGKLDDLSIPEIVRMLVEGAKTATVTVIADAGGGAMSFDCGRLVHARTPSAVGEPAFEELYGLLDGQFIVEHGAATAERSIDRRTDELVAEAESIRSAASDASLSTPSLELPAISDIGPAPHPPPARPVEREATRQPAERAPEPQPTDRAELRATGAESTPPGDDADVVAPAWPALAALLRPTAQDGDDTVQLTRPPADEPDDPPELTPEPTPPELEPIAE